MTLDSVITTPKVLLSTSTFWFWNQPYDPIKSIHLIRDLHLPLDGIDIWFFATKDLNIPKFDQVTIEFLNTLEYVTLHTDFYDYDWRGEVDFDEFRQRLKKLYDMCLQLGIRDFVVHADFLIRHTKRIFGLLKEEFPDVRISFEFMDKDKFYGNHPEHFKDVFLKDDSFGLVVDLAHLQDFTSEFDWTDFFYDPVLKTHITFVHASNHSRSLEKSFYAELGCDDLNAVHALCLSDTTIFSKKLLDECRKYPIILEGIVPPGEIGAELLRREIKWVKTGNLQ